MPDYRAYIVGQDGHFQTFHAIVADDEAGALRVAEELVGDNDVELWQLDRKISVLSQRNRTAS